jgi:23S rRNA (guanine2535-N1)-methyltransferase
MQYRLAVARSEYRDLASGFVLRSAPGFPAFPARLAEELFLRCAAHATASGPLTLWDPCCGSGYLATVIGLSNRATLDRILCSDVSPDAVTLASRNLALLTAAGLEGRERELLGRASEFGKQEYAERAAAARRLYEVLQASGGDLPGSAVRADVFDPAALAALPPADLVITDAPYGDQTEWQGTAPAAGNPLRALLGSLCQVLPGHAVVALCARQRRVTFDPPLPALERFRIGHRAAFVGRAAELRAAL